jgi:hypothetical protein
LIPAENPPKLPPVRVARAVDAVRRRMRRVEQRMVPAPAAVLDLVTGAWVSRAIYTAAKFGIADVLSEGPRSAEEFSLSMATAGVRVAGRRPGIRRCLQRGNDRRVGN